MKKKYFKVYYRCKANGNGSFFGVAGETNKAAAIRATHMEMDMKRRSGYYAPECYPMTEDEFNKLTIYHFQRPNVRWD